MSEKNITAFLVLLSVVHVAVAILRKMAGAMAANGIFV